MEPIAALIIWALSMVIMIFVIGAGVRVGMRWSRIDERKEQEQRNSAGFEPNKKFN